MTCSNLETNLDDNMWLTCPQMSCNVLPTLSIKERPSSSWMVGQLIVRIQKKKKEKESTGRRRWTGGQQTTLMV